MNYNLKSFDMAVSVTKIANLHYFEFTNEYHTKKDTHEFRELIYVDSGRIYTKAESYSGILDTNQLIIHKPLEVNSLSCTGDTAPNVIIIGFESDCDELDCFSEAPFTLNADLQKILTEIVKEGRTVFMPPYDVPNLRDMRKQKNYPFGSDQMIKIQLETLFIKLIRSKKSTDALVTSSDADAKIYEVYDYLLKNFREHIKLDELCFLFNTNKTTLCQNFKKAYGQTIVEFVNSLKIKEAKVLMREGKYNLTEISAMLGFNSIHYFSRMFKEIEHRSPSLYIKTIKAKLGV